LVESVAAAKQAAPAPAPLSKAEQTARKEAFSEAAELLRGVSRASGMKVWDHRYRRPVLLHALIGERSIVLYGQDLTRRLALEAVRAHGFDGIVFKTTWAGITEVDGVTETANGIISESAGGGVFEFIQQSGPFVLNEITAPEVEGLAPATR
jgi:hypothetical protein